MKRLTVYAGDSGELNSEHTYRADESNFAGHKRQLVSKT